jgi:hypothetical protein
LKDAAFHLECFPTAVVLFAPHREAIWTNRAAANLLAAPTGWTVMPGDDSQDGAYAWGCTPGWVAWIRSMVENLDRPGGWPREIVILSGIGSGKWLASELTDGRKKPLGVLLTAL